MNEQGTMDGADARLRAPIFISYATADRKQALTICKAIERRAIGCWMSARDVAPGENYQEAIVRALRQAPAMVLVFSQNANDSDEIKKELSLASRYRVPVIALRIQDVEPSDAFAYELSTRQWINAFQNREKAIDALVRQLKPRLPEAQTTSSAASSGKGPVLSRRVLAAGTVAVLLALVAAAWWMLRPSPATPHSMTVRLAGFQLLSADLPTTTRDAVGSEITAAFNADGVIGVSTASAPSPGSAPAYALGGTIHRVGDSVRVITRLTNERTGAILWSDSVDYAADQVAKVPHKVAVDAGTVIRCGLFGASTYHKTLPDPVLGNYMQYCQEYWSYGGTRTLRFAQLVVAALPDFSWGWSAVANGFLQAAQAEPDAGRAEQLRASGREAEAKALALDGTNSEALAHKAYLIDPHDWVAQEALFKNAIAAKPLDCGCEHYGYGLKLESVGRLGDAVEQYRAATDMLALWPDSQLALGAALVATGRMDEAKPHFQAAADLSKDAAFDKQIAVAQGTETGEYPAAIAALRDPHFEIAEDARTALLTGYEALASGDAQAKFKAVQLLVDLGSVGQSDRVPPMLAALGASREALGAARDKPSLFWRPSMRRVLDEPGFPAVAKQLGLITYWKTTHTRPDVCRTQAPPPFCRMI